MQVIECFTILQAQILFYVNQALVSLDLLLLIYFFTVFFVAKCHLVPEKSAAITAP